ncbi:MAG TPA: prenyltransferase/squalene oxidase repeat-containing protein [Pseudomonadota bacterium]|nr:prenyltransferase/squalene oxidase repeat-containing protein [Pseudomonadota bacterium]
MTMNTLTSIPSSSSHTMPLTLLSSPLDAAMSHLRSLQKADGGFEGEMVWNTMILSQYILTQRAIGKPIDKQTADKMVLHYRTTRCKDGAWGMHGESDGYVYFTAMAYVALRVLGVSASDPLCADARAWLARQPEGVLGIPHWGKFWLAMCGLYGWDGVNPFPPELFVTPKWLPIHPFRFYNHTRYIYLGIAYLYGKRFQISLGDLLPTLRSELYDQAGRRPYGEIDFHSYRHVVAKTDLYVAPSLPLKAAYEALHAYEKRPIAALRQYALGFCLDRILYEMRASKYQCISPVNGLLNCLAIYSHNPQHPELASCLLGLEAWKWEDEAEGIRYCGARSNTWDTAFAILSLTEADRAQQLAPHNAETLRRAYAHLCSLQMQTELDGWEAEQREPIRGGWCFSDGEHRWPVSDCTAEAVCALLSLHYEGSPVPESDRLPVRRFVEAAHFILRRQNEDGGFGSYEARRGGSLLEKVNPSEMYGACMTERSYLECTSSCLRGLLALRNRLGAKLGGSLLLEINTAIGAAVMLLRKSQRPDGSFPGFWGINFTYGIFHVVEALHEAGIPSTDPAIQRAAVWLLGKQRPDGGFGEHYSSCLTGEYVAHSESQVVNTSWALLTLLLALPPSHEATQRGLDFLCKMQGKDGGFPQQAQAGVFFGTAMLDYRLYKSYFPLWALSRAARLGQELRHARTSHPLTR